MPGADDAAPAVPAPGYFESLPEAAMPALTRLWDAVTAATGKEEADDLDEQTFDAFFDDVRALGHREPEWRHFLAFAKAIRAGEVERPAKQIGEDVAENNATADAIVSSDFAFVAEDYATGRAHTIALCAFREEPRRTARFRCAWLCGPDAGDISSRPRRGARDPWRGGVL